MPSTNDELLTITPNNQNAVPTARYVRLIVVLTTILLTLFCLFLFERLLAMIHHTVLLFALGALVAYALDPIVEFVRGRPLETLSAKEPEVEIESTPASASGPQPLPARTRKAKQRPRWLGVVTVFATVFLVLGLGMFFLGRQVIHQAQALARDKNQIRENAIRKLDSADTWLHSRGVSVSLSDQLTNPPDSVKKWEADAAKKSLTAASDVSRFTVEGLVVLLIAIYFLLFSEHLRGATTRLFPANIQPYVSQWQDDVNTVLGGFVRGQAVLALVLGTSAAVACALLGLRFWLLIGLFVTVASLIPVIGPYIGAIPAIISALLTQHGMLSPGVRVVLVLIAFVILNEVGSKVLYPRLVGKALGLHEMVVLFVLLAGLEIGGIVGTLFAAPLTALAIVTVLQVYRAWRGDAPTGLSASAPADTPTSSPP